MPNLSTSRPPRQVFVSFDTQTLHAGRGPAHEGGRVETHFHVRKCLYRSYLQHVSFRCAQLSALRTSFSTNESCFSIRTVWDEYRYGGSSIDDTRHRGQLVRVSVHFRALKNTERAGHDGKATFVALSPKCDSLLGSNRASHNDVID